VNVYGGLVASGPGTGSNAVTTAFAQLTGFTGNSQAYSQQAGREAIIPDFANNRILVEKGKYKVEFSASFLQAAASNKIFTAGVSKNGAAPTDLVGSFTGINFAGAVLDTGFTGILNVLDGDCSELPYVGPAVPANIPSTPQPTQQPPVAAITLLIKGGASDTLVLQWGQFTLFRLED
jgi:hypothetical protein